MIRFSVIFLIFIFSFSPKLYSAEGSTYSFDWLDKDKEVYVLQNRKYRKVSHFYLNIGGAYVMTDSFATTWLGTLRAGYFFWESWGLEAILSYGTGSENSTAEAVRGIPGVTPGSIPFRRILSGYGGLMVTWSPFYSKTNLFNGIVYSDLIFGLGIVAISDYNNAEEVLSGRPGSVEDEKESHTGVIFELGWNLYFGKGWQVRVDITNINYFAHSVVEESTHFGSTDVALSIGYRF